MMADGLRAVRAGLTSLERETCLAMLNLLSKQKDADPFRAPVDWQALGLDDYPTLVKRPMDMRTMREKVRTGAYASMAEWHADLELIWANARFYNGADSPVTRCANKLAAVVERRMGDAREMAAAVLGLAPASAGGGARRNGVAGSGGGGDYCSDEGDSDSDADERPLPRGSGAGQQRPPLKRMVPSGAAADGGASKRAKLTQLQQQHAATPGLRAAAVGGWPSSRLDGAAAAAAAGAVSLPGVDYGGLEQLVHTEPACQLGVTEPDDLAFLVLWRRLLTGRASAVAEVAALRQSAALACEQAWKLEAQLRDEVAARGAAEAALQELRAKHDALQEAHTEQARVLENQRALLDQQQQVLRKLLSKQQGAAAATPPQAQPAPARAATVSEPAAQADAQRVEVPSPPMAAPTIVPQLDTRSGGDGNGVLPVGPSGKGGQPEE